MLKLSTAVTYGHSLAVFLISMLFFSSCQKEEFLLEEKKVTLTSTETSVRSSLYDCENLIVNGDFENGTVSSNAFAINNVPNWNCFNGSSDLFSDVFSPFLGYRCI